MNVRAVRRIVWRVLLFLGVLVFITCGISLRSSAQLNTHSSHEDQLQELLVLRESTLHEYAEGMLRRLDAGVAESIDAALAINLLLEARLELASSKEERVYICEQQVDNFRHFEEAEVLGNAAGVATQSDVLFAKSGRLKAEIDCVRRRDSAQGLNEASF